MGVTKTSFLQMVINRKETSFLCIAIYQNYIQPQINAVKERYISILVLRCSTSLLLLVGCSPLDQENVGAIFHSYPI